jgi:uncharacterized membrane protein YphA (DoxX/SURF4 family)
MPDWIPVVAAVIVGIVFLVAGGSKIAAGPEWPVQARGLGAPAIVIPAVPWVEILIGAALVVQIARRPAAAAAIAVLVVFSVLLIGQLARGHRPPCACFGTWSVKPLGLGHVVRNTALIGLGVLALL